MAWHGYESTGQVESEHPMCRVVLDLLDLEPGAAAVSIRMGADASRALSELRDDRLALAEALKREFSTAVDSDSPGRAHGASTTSSFSYPSYFSVSNPFRNPPTTRFPVHGVTHQSGANTVTERDGLPAQCRLQSG